MAGFSRFPTQREHILTSGDTTIGVIPELSLVSHFQVGSWQVLYRPEGTGNVKRWGMPLMIPNFSRLKDGVFQEKGTSLPIHGFGRNLPWIVIAQDTTHISIQLSSSDATRTNYPYEFTFTATITVAEAMLTYTLTMANRSAEIMPSAPGFHPYFAIAQEDKAKLTVDGLPDFIATAIQWDTQPPDIPYHFPHRVVVHMPDGGALTIEELPIAGRYSLANMQVWSEPATAPDHAFVCFEPTVSTEDALNRPSDRLNIAPHSEQQIILRLSAKPS